MTLQIRTGGHDGTLIAFEKNVYSLRSPAAFAPGQPLEIVVCARGGTAEFVIEARAIGSKLEEDGVYLVRARAINLRREQRESIAHALALGK